MKIFTLQNDIYEDCSEIIEAAKRILVKICIKIEQTSTNS